MLKESLKRLIGPTTMGLLDYYRFPALRIGCGGPFNGQDGRREIVDAILEACDIRQIVETGTFRGTTTEYIAKKTQLPTFTVEADPRYASYATMRLRGASNVRVLHMDSRIALREISSLVTKPFCYLDAHWYDDLPIHEEVATVFDQWPDAVVMIDDFEVEGDSGYEFDDYGDGKRLCLANLIREEKWKFAVFFPTLHSSEESGHKRGCVVLAKVTSTQARRLQSISLLRHTNILAIDTNVLLTFVLYSSGFGGNCVSTAKKVFSDSDVNSLPVAGDRKYAS